MEKTALIAMSGGVDSSVAAAKMIEAGYRCIGVTMKLYAGGGDADVQEAACCSPSEAEAARSVACRLGMKYDVLDFSDDFSSQVIDRFVGGYERGYTPNPCIDCNRHLKFEKLYRHALQLGYDTIATGHYARVEYDRKKGRWTLKKAKNLAKDQSYVLYFLSQEQLAHTCFPLGDMTDKEEVRQLAEKYGFPNAHKKDSQDICFVPDGKYADFIRGYTGREYPPGDFVDEAGHVLGRHKGIIGYTVGQRRGLGLSLPAPLYVRRKCVAENTVVLSPEESLYTTRLLAEDFCWIAGEPPVAPIRAAARTRYAAKEAPATITSLPDGRAEVVFDQPQRAVTEGQAVVLYDGDEVLGGGTICQV